MDITMLANQLVAFLAPFLPFLVKMGEQAAEESGKKLGSEAWDMAKSFYRMLTPKIEASPAMNDMLEKAASHPADSRTTGAVEVLLEDALEADKQLASDLERKWIDWRQATQIHSAQGGIIVEGHVNDAIIVKGDGNVIQKHK
ncbi:MAG: hypothetical protein WCF84_11105 [Anaerolineae bacterium]